MAEEKKREDRKLSVETLHNVFRLLEGEGLLEDFLAQCESRGYQIRVSDELYAFGKAELGKVPVPETAGPDCPACPPDRS